LEIKPAEACIKWLAAFLKSNIQTHKCDLRQVCPWSKEHCFARAENIKIRIRETEFERMDWTGSDARLFG
jgi:hypothetical protein